MILGWVQIGANIKIIIDMETHEMCHLCERIVWCVFSISHVCQNNHCHEMVANTTKQNDIWPDVNKYKCKLVIFVQINNKP